jgi:hypothetical protein
MGETTDSSRLNNSVLIKPAIIYIFLQFVVSYSTYHYLMLSESTQGDRFIVSELH